MTLWLADKSCEPMVTFTGLQRNSAASFWMEVGHVAENMRVCLSARVCCAIALQRNMSGVGDSTTRLRKIWAM